jgi:hypothetical protein
MTNICINLYYKLIFGDSILRGSAGTVRTLLNEKYNVLSVIKPGADFKELNP